MPCTWHNSRLRNIKNIQIRICIVYLFIKTSPALEPTNVEHAEMATQGLLFICLVNRVILSLASCVTNRCADGSLLKLNCPSTYTKFIPHHFAPIIHINKLFVILMLFSVCSSKSFKITAVAVLSGVASAFLR